MLDFISVSLVSSDRGGKRRSTFRPELWDLEARLAPAAPGSYDFGSPLSSDASVFTTRYNAWKSSFVTSNGAGGNLRVVSSVVESNDTVSEGQAYGMILAAYADDKSTFDRLWAYAKSKFNSRGLMAWCVRGDGSIRDANCATDGDLDIAYALIVADRKWGGYGNDARTLINNILTHCVTGDNILKPGDVWGGWDAVNPSYFAPAYFKVFADYTGQSRWYQVRDKCYEILGNINRYNNNTGLVPNWCKADGTAATFSGATYFYGGDAARISWRLAKDYAWHGDGRAKAQLDRLNGFFASVGAYNIGTEYWLNGSQKSGWNHAQWVLAPIASGAVASSNGTFRSNMWSKLNETQHDTGYYGRSLQALGTLFAVGRMAKPGDIGGGGGGGGSGSTSPLFVYADSLSSGWSNWSWNANVNFDQSSIVRNGSRAAAVTYTQNGGGFSLRSASNISTSGYTAIRFWVHGGSGSNKSLRVGIQTADTGGESSAVNITATAGQWTEITVNLSSIGNPSTIKRINITNNTGSSNVTVYFDDIRLV